ncbi:amino acid ABC transporter permease [Ramlibacter solisilvae]|uniref:Amino acid ABC transporter permease n=1 Tax=Ramlibacter tataouinensis TaxID=94132 RepID=A0A127K1R4_9BURK|nr:ABC transporter permease subunit [Ramlibacter tataouinensis]AMO25212.1 amino acid ABC transporter permease [Ramlibacter tataouinensis]
MWSSERFRRFVYQFALLLLIAAVAGYAVSNLVHNLQSRSITIGFSYLQHEAGFDISEKLIAYEPAHSYGRAFVVGLLNTLYVSACAIVVASLLGLAIGIARLSPNWLLRQLAGGYVETVRNVPLILQLLMWYGMLTELLPPVGEAWRLGFTYLSQRGLTMPWPEAHAGWSAALLGVVAAVVVSLLWSRRAQAVQVRTGKRLPVAWPSLVAFVLLPSIAWAALGAPTGFSRPELAGFDFEGGRTVSPEFITLFVGLSVYTAAFIAEIVRGGIQSVPKGQIDASEALGLSRAQRLRLVVLPQALRVIIPPLTSQYLNLTKNSSLAVAIGYPDLVSVSTTTLNQTGQAIEAIGLMMAVYLLISLAISGLMNWYNYRVRLVER